MGNSCRTRIVRDRLTAPRLRSITSPRQTGTPSVSPIGFVPRNYGVRNGRCRKAVGESGSWRTQRTSPRRRQSCDLHVIQKLCGAACHETWCFTCVTPKGQKLLLPYEPPMILLVVDTKALMFVLRVICGDNDRNPEAGQKRIFASWSEAFLAQAQAHLLPHRLQSVRRAVLKQHVRRSVPVR